MKQAPKVAGPEPIDRQTAIRRLQRKRSFWRHVSWYAVLNLGFWLSWVIGGLREEWVAPWPIIPTVVWGAFVLYQERRLGGRHAVSHETIDIELEELRQRNAAISEDGLARRPILFGEPNAYAPLPHFHLQDVLDARERRAHGSEIDESVS